MTRYLFQRVVHNDGGWKRPTPGRFKSKVDGGYIQDHGFAGEDWNFALDDEVDGYISGYSAYIPKDRSGNFSIIMAVYDRLGGWSVVGLYEGATFVDGGSYLPNKIIARRGKELYDIRRYCGDDWSKRSLAEMRLKARELHVESPWKVPTTGVRQFTPPVPISLSFSPGSHFRTAKSLTFEQFTEVMSQVEAHATREAEDDYGDGGEVEFPEGRTLQMLHFKRERSIALVKAAKTRFKKRYGSLFCEGCGFSFSETYGVIGDDFIEAHHVIPVHLLKEDSVTKVSDLLMVCSNCHRMLHRRRPCLDKDKLKDLIQKMSERV